METNKIMKATDGFDSVTGLNRFGRKKGDIKVRPADEPGFILVDCPANQYGKLPPMKFMTKEKSRELTKKQWEEDERRKQERWAAMTPQERAEEEARRKARWERCDAFDEKYNVNFTSEEIRNWKYEAYGYEPDYYDRIYGTDEEIFGAYEELYGNK
jgi:hypothetical protein